MPASFDFKAYIRDVPDFPKPGIVFKDITPLLMHPEAFREAIKALVAPYRGKNINKVVGIESRGFIFGAAAAIELGAGFVPIRKKGKLPSEVVAESYALEYGNDTVEIHADSLKTEDRVIMIDDLLATGGTASASIKLIRRIGVKVIGASFLIDLTFLEGRKKLADVKVHSVIDY